MKFRKKPVVIEAFRFDVNKNLPEWARRNATWRDNDLLVIETLEGQMIANPGDWIIRGVKGEVYPCRNDIFEATYEMVETEPDEQPLCL